MSRKNIITIMILVLFIVTLACGSNSNVVVKPPNSAPVTGEDNVSPPISEEPTMPPIGTSRNNPAPVGSEVSSEGMSFLVLSSTRPATDIVMEGNMFNTEPEEGQEYIFVELQVTCLKPSDQQCNFYLTNFTLVGSSGIGRDSKLFLSGVDGLLETSDFYGGASISGQIAFIVDQNETDLILVHDPFLGDVFYLAIQ